MENFFTTGDVAKITGLSQKTVKNYCDQGRIISENTPVSNYRRIKYDSLCAFMNNHGIPLQRIRECKTVKILVVDDDFAVRELIVRALKLLAEDTFSSLDIGAACDGYEGCIKAGIMRPDLIILDLNMPNTDGFGVIQHIKKEPELLHTEIVVCTGYASFENKEMLSGYGVKHILTKPVELDNLLQTVQNVITGDRSLVGHEV